VALSGGQVTLTDLGSSYGTFLAGGQKLAPNQPVTLRVGDRFYLGSEKEGFVITGKGGSLT
jgi:pSer/pThr/pTyr-binding forkhead associated (FHA) protein